MCNNTRALSLHILLFDFIGLVSDSSVVRSRILRQFSSLCLASRFLRPKAKCGCEFRSVLLYMFDLKRDTNVSMCKNEWCLCEHAICSMLRFLLKMFFEFKVERLKTNVSCSHCYNSLCKFSCGVSRNF